MENVLRVLFSGLLFILSGFMFGTAFWNHRERKHREKLDETETALTEPESYIWVKVEDRLPTHNRDYLVEYYFESSPNLRFASVHRFNVRERRFQYENSRDFSLKVVRWAELPK